MSLLLRAANDVRWVSGIAVPWNDPISYMGEQEMFERGSLIPQSEPIPLRWQHDKVDIPIGVVDSWENRDEGLWVECRLLDSDAANAAWQAAYEGLARGFSIEFDNMAPAPGIASGFGAQGTVTRAKMVGLSLVENPAYERAKIVSVRDAEECAKPIMDLAEKWLQYYQYLDGELQ